MKIPPLIYGTAWKQEATAKLVKCAVAAGFRGIDTANQKKHYREDYTGGALLEIYSHGISREDLFLQSKYTYQEGQDQRLPYDPYSDYTTQVNASFAGSLKNLHTDYLDAYLLHGPRSSHAMTAGDWEVWAAMEKLQESGQARMIGISNAGLQHLIELSEKARIKPRIVQNRCYAVGGWDKSVREFCLKNRIIYQGFSLLTANQQICSHPRVAAIAGRYGATPEQVILRFAVQIGILPLTGTTDPRHMKEDLEIEKFELPADDVRQIYELH